MGRFDVKTAHILVHQKKQKNMKKYVDKWVVMPYNKSCRW